MSTQQLRGRRADAGGARHLFSASHCIVAALPLLHRGQSPHLVGVARAVTYLPLRGAGVFGPCKAELHYLRESLLGNLTQKGITITVVTRGFIITTHSESSGIPIPMRRSAHNGARRIAKRLDARPLEIAFPGPFIAALGLSGRLPARLQLALGRRLARGETCPDTPQACAGITRPGTIGALFLSPPDAAQCLETCSTPCCSSLAGSPACSAAACGCGA